MTRLFAFLLAFAALGLLPCADSGAAQTKLANGLVVLPVENRSTDVCAVHLTLSIGAERVPRPKAGLGALVQQSLLAHMRRRLAERDDLVSLRAAENEGAGLSVQASWDAMEFLGQVTSRDLAGLLALFAEAIFGAELTQDDIVGAREVLGRTSGPGGALGANEAAIEVYELFRKALYGDSPLAQPLLHDDDGAASLSLADVRSFHRTYYVPALASVCVVAPMSEPEIIRAVTAAFGALKSREVAKVAAPSTAAGDSRVRAGTSPAANTAMLVVGVPLPPVGTDGYRAGLVMHAALSGPRGSLTSDRTLRPGLQPLGGDDDSDLVRPYDVVPVPMSRAPYLAAVARCHPRAIEDMRKGLLRHLMSFAQAPLTDEDLRRAKLRAINLHALELATPGNLATYVDRCHLLGADYKGEAEFAARIMALSAQDLQACAKAEFTRHAVGVLLPEG